jgi:hypothetical protein
MSKRYQATVRIRCPGKDGVERLIEQGDTIAPSDIRRASFVVLTQEGALVEIDGTEEAPDGL